MAEIARGEIVLHPPGEINPPIDLCLESFMGTWFDSARFSPWLRQRTNEDAYANLQARHSLYVTALEGV